MELSTRQRVPCENTGSFATLASAFTNFTKFVRGRNLSFGHSNSTGFTAPPVLERERKLGHHALQIMRMIED